MTAEDYRKDPERVARARALLANRDLQEMLSVIVMNAPCTATVDPAISPQLAEILYGQETGHFGFYTKLLSLGTHLVPLSSMDDAALSLEPED